MEVNPPDAWRTYPRICCDFCSAEQTITPAQKEAAYLPPLWAASVEGLHACDQCTEAQVTKSQEEEHTPWK